MGWNRVFHQLRRGDSHPVWAGIADSAWFYFVHSFHAHPEQAAHSVGETDYGGRFPARRWRATTSSRPSSIRESADQGLALYRNFLHWNPDFRSH